MATKQIDEKKEENKKKIETKEQTKARIKKENERFAKSLISSINGKKGDTRIAYSLNDELPTEYISTGSTLLDYLISNQKNGGIPIGKISEISGMPGAGKSLIMSHIAANTQKKGGIAVYMDTENAANSDFMTRVGVDLNRLVYLQPQTIEAAFDHLEKVIIKTREKFPNKERPVTIIWDSIAATPPQAEIEGDYDPNSRIGVAAKAMSKGMRKLTQTVGREHVTLVFTNQLREKIGVMYGDPYTTPAGHAVPFHASARVRLTVKQDPDLQDSDTKDKLGVKCKAKVMKTRQGPPFRTCEFSIMFDHGIDDEQSWMQFLHEKKVITKSNGWYKMNINSEEKKFQNPTWKKFLSQDNHREIVLAKLEELLVKKAEAKEPEIDLDSVNDLEHLEEMK